jgi:hypothetical protein
MGVLIIGIFQKKRARICGLFSFESGLISNEIIYFLWRDLQGTEPSLNQLRGVLAILKLH